MKTLPLMKTIALTAVLVISCAPIPMIQSARVTGKAGIGLSYTSPAQTVTVKEVESDFNSSKTFIRDSYSLIEQSPVRTFFRFGIMNRVELTTSIQPTFLLIIPTIKGNLKVALFDRGSEKLFRNISMAAFYGGDYYPSEWKTYENFWGGIITGTHQNIGNFDMELVCMISGSYSYLKYYSDGFGVRHLTCKTANASFGYIVRPLNIRSLEMNMGIAFRAPVSKNYSFKPYRISSICVSEIQEYKINPVVFQCGLQFYVPRSHKRRTSN